MIAAAALLLGGCSAGAQPMCQYDFYIYQPQGERDGQIYAIAGAGRAAAIQVNACDASWYSDPTGLVTELRAMRRADEANIVTVPAQGSRTYLGSCRGSSEHDQDIDYDRESSHTDNEANIVVITDASAAQTRRLIQQIDAASDEMRQETIDTLGLRGCMGQTSARR
jgi:hypothetical protein